MHRWRVAPEEEEQWNLKSSGVAGSLFLRRSFKVSDPPKITSHREEDKKTLLKILLLWLLMVGNGGEGRVQCT